jgi:hypothetical protein
MEKTRWADLVKNEEALQRVKEQRNILRTIKRRKTNWIGQILGRNCILKHIIEGKGKRGKTRKKTSADTI